jgi:hypothetical protein
VNGRTTSRDPVERFEKRKPKARAVQIVPLQPEQDDADAHGD